MGDILVGTTSWTETTLIRSGRFYPRDVKTPEDRLRYYATRFRIAEVDSSYYGIPSEHNAALWAERTPERFVFDVKAFRLFTHHRTPAAALPPDLRAELGASRGDAVYIGDLPAAVTEELWRRLRSALEPLRAAGKLGVVLLQFAPWFIYRRQHFAYIEDCARWLEGVGAAVEFRNKTWLSERNRREVLAFEQRLGISHVVVDEPQGTSFSVPAVWKATQPRVAVVRLHGRNRATWTKTTSSAAERFAYRYSGAELEELAAPVRRLAGETDKVHVLFNNCYQDYAQDNAASMRSLLAV